MCKFARSQPTEHVVGGTVRLTVKQQQQDELCIMQFSSLLWLSWCLCFLGKLKSFKHIITYKWFVLYGAFIMLLRLVRSWEIFYLANNIQVYVNFC